jgi:hypothetical protein
MGRRPIGDTAMTAAERQQKRRARLRTGQRVGARMCQPTPGGSLPAAPDGEKGVATIDTPSRLGPLFGRFHQQ